MKQMHRSTLTTTAAALVVILSGCATSAVRPTSGAPEASGVRETPQVVLVSMDGFRRSYLDTDSVPTLHALGR